MNIEINCWISDNKKIGYNFRSPEQVISVVEGLEESLFASDHKIKELEARLAEAELRTAALKTNPDYVEEIEEKLAIAIEALEELKDIRRLDGNGNEYEGREHFIAKKALKEITPN